MVKRSYTLQSVLPDNSSTYLASYIVVTILSPIFPVLYFTSPWLFITNNLWSSVPVPCNFLKILFIFRERGREGDREGGKRWCEKETSIGCLSNMSQPGNPGMCPDWELKWQPFGLWECPTNWATPVWTPSSFHLVPQNPSCLATISLFSVSMSLFLLCLFVYIFL